MLCIKIFESIKQNSKTAITGKKIGILFFIEE